MSETQNTQNTQETQEVQTITINDKVYRTDSITENGINLINDIKKVDAELGRILLQKSITELAKTKLMEVLEMETPNFIEIKSEAADSKEA